MIAAVDINVDHQKALVRFLGLFPPQIKGDPLRLRGLARGVCSKVRLGAWSQYCECH
jgi:hypothetical protein